MIQMVTLHHVQYLELNDLKQLPLSEAVFFCLNIRTIGACHCEQRIISWSKKNAYGLFLDHIELLDIQFPYEFGRFFFVKKNRLDILPS